MDMSGMGMSMSDSSGFVVTNSSLARSYWYIIAGVVAFCFLLRILDHIQTRIRSVQLLNLVLTLRELSRFTVDLVLLVSNVRLIHRLQISRSRSVKYPTKPQNVFAQSYATATAIFREMVSPELRFKNRWFSWLSPPPLGRSLVIATYWAVIIYMLCWESVVLDAYYWERIGFRAAWTSVTQVPFVYLLASKSSIIGVLSGSSHERLNWLHRWVSRTLLVTVSIHGSFFYREWVGSGNIGTQSFVAFELSLMPMVKYGMGAWFVLVWTFLSSLTPIRRLSYEFFVLQHLAAAAVFLWLLWVHVPSYAQYNIWFAIAAVAFDRVFLLCWSSWENVRLRPTRSAGGTKTKIIGHHAELRAIDDETSEVVVKDISFKWKPGQHIYLRLPAMGPLESHPFTIANNCGQSSLPSAQDIHLVIQAQSGFTRRLHRKAKSAMEGRAVGLTAIVTGPFGCPPAWNSFETLILISASTGASFTMPILESVLSSKCNTCVSRIDILMIVRRRCGIDAYLPRLDEAVANAAAVGIELSIIIAVTGESESDLAGFSSHDNLNGGARLEGCQCGINTGSSSDSISEEREDNEKQLITREKVIKPCCCGTGKDKVTYTCGRPDIAAFIRAPVEVSGGETSVAVCGGNSLVAVVRNAVASLSDERAVHKGTGAQGIHLHTEHYCF